MRLPRAPLAALTIALAFLAAGYAAATGSAGSEPPLRFAWPRHGEALVEVTDERKVGGASSSGVISMRLRVSPDGATDRLVLRFSEARIVSVGGVPPAKADPAGVAVAVARVMKQATPTIVVSREGRYVESRDLDRVVGEVIVAAGFPGIPLGVRSLEALLTDVAERDWDAWVGAWIGKGLAPGEWTETESEQELDGAPVPVKVTRRGLDPGSEAGRGRFQIETLFPSSSVRSYASGFLIDMARDAGELGEDDFANKRFLDRARFGPVTETLTVELETATMRPIAVERVRTFSAVAGKHRVDGRERRAHRFVWRDAGGS